MKILVQGGAMIDIVDFMQRTPMQVSAEIGIKIGILTTLVPGPISLSAYQKEITTRERCWHFASVLHPVLQNFSMCKWLLKGVMHLSMQLLLLSLKPEIIKENKEVIQEVYVH